MFAETMAWLVSKAHAKRQGVLASLGPWSLHSPQEQPAVTWTHAACVSAQAARGQVSSDKKELARLFCGSVLIGALSLPDQMLA